MVNKKLLLTFDYELFLGPASGNPKECMINPTRKLLEIMQPYNIKAIFFVDTTYIIKLKEAAHHSLKEDLKIIEEQLNLLIKEGHYVFPHIHPHWLDAVYNENSAEWRLEEYSKYRFHNIVDEEKEILFNKSINYLASLYKSNNVEYNGIGYRAGGWCIQPFHDFLPYFIKYNIIADFSVLPYCYNLEKNQYFDFRKISEKNIYKYSEDIQNINPQGSLYEFPISTVSFSKWVKFKNRVWQKYLWKKGIRSFGNGRGAKIKPMSSSKDMEMASVELLTLPKLKTYTSFFEKNIFFQLITHPKMVSSHNLKVFERFLKIIFSKYSIETDYRKML